MIAYLDSSVILRVVLGQEGALSEWTKVRTPVTSELTEVECLRTLDRLRMRAGVPDDAIATRRETVYRLLESMEVVEVGRTVLRRASQPLPTLLGTLDAIHLASAVLWREATDREPAFATHDVSLATAARALGLRVLGV